VWGRVGIQGAADRPVLGPYAMSGGVTLRTRSSHLPIPGAQGQDLEKQMQERFLVGLALYN
jgi:hypothetical protein